MPARERINVQRAPSRCPFCHASCGVNDPNVVCHECLARHHVECWREHAACGSCSGTVPLAAVELPSERRVETPRSVAPPKQDGKLASGQDPFVPLGTVLLTAAAALWVVVGDSSAYILAPLSVLVLSGCVFMAIGFLRSRPEDN